MKIKFYKYEGTGNDFILIDNRDKKLKAKNPKLWKKLCDRHFGIGADGLMLIQNKKGYDFEMVYFNADGNESTMCGNGGRCIAHLAKKLEIVKGKSVKFIAIDGEHEALFTSKNIVKLKMSDVKNINDQKSYYILNTGSPHFVTMVDDIMKLSVKEDGRVIRNSAPFKKEGINVNFVEVQKNKVPILRTYERGVEDETLSCGTGTVATALVLATKGLANAKDHCDIQTMGGMLKVWFRQQNGGFKDIWLEGPATYVFSGNLKSMIFSENKNSFTLKTSPLTSTEQIKSGLWLTLIGVNEIPPHIALINDGEYYSQSAKKVDCGTPLDKFINVIQRKQISTIFIHIVTNNVIARNEAISANLLLEKIYKNLLPLSNVTNTCLSPIKAFFAEYYATEFSNTNYVFELLALAETKGLLKKSVSLFCEDSNSNIVTLPKYTMVQIQEKIQSLAIPVMSVK